MALVSRAIAAVTPTAAAAPAGADELSAAAVSEGDGEVSEESCVTRAESDSCCTGTVSRAMARYPAAESAVMEVSPRRGEGGAVAERGASEGGPAALSRPAVDPV